MRQTIKSGFIGGLLVGFAALGFPAYGVECDQQGMRRMSGMMHDMSGMMKDMSESMSRGGMTAEQREIMSERMGGMSKDSMSEMMSRGMMMDSRQMQEMHDRMQEMHKHMDGIDHMNSREKQ
jgi:hypothetical protein